MKETESYMEQTTEETVEEMVTEETLVTDLCTGEQSFVLTEHDYTEPAREIGGNIEINSNIEQNLSENNETDLICNEQMFISSEEENNS